MSSDKSTKNVIPTTQNNSDVVKMRKSPWVFCITLPIIVVVILYTYISIGTSSKTWMLVSTQSPKVDINHVTTILMNANRSLTVVTAFFNIGKFPKGSMANIRTPTKYKLWMNVFSNMQNPVVFYTDSKDIGEYFKHIRKNCTSGTKVLILSRQSLWSFQIMPKIAKLYSTPGYPKHYPNTHIPAYTSMTHSKFPVLANATLENFYETRYFCWLDIGYFRDIVHRKKKFWLEVPSDFINTKVAVTRVYNRTLKNIRAKTIIYGNLNWIGGGLFLGEQNQILRFAEQYKQAVIRYLNQGLMNVEQHILYSMFTEDERKNNPIDVDLQLYIPGKQKVLIGNPWFYLGYVMYDEKV